MRTIAEGMRALEVWAKTRSKRTRIVAGVMAIVFLGLYGLLLWSGLQYTG